MMCTHTFPLIQKVIVNNMLTTSLLDIYLWNHFENTLDLMGNVQMLRDHQVTVSLINIWINEVGKWKQTHIPGSESKSKDLIKFFLRFDFE